MQVRVCRRGGGFEAGEIKEEGGRLRLEVDGVSYGPREAATAGITSVEPKREQDREICLRWWAAFSVR